jgi:cell division protein FtsB
VEISMQGAMARICQKYHDIIHSTAPYNYFGERNEEGSAMNRRSMEFHSIYRGYMTEREYNAVSMEYMLKKHISLMDQFREVMDITSKRITHAESVLVMMDDQRTELKERIKTLEDPQKLEEELLCNNTWAHVLEKTLLLQCKLHKSKEEKDQLRKDNGELKMENDELKKKISELEAKVEEEEEDPKERVMYTTDGEEMAIEECKAREEAKRCKIYPLACLDRIKRR